MYFSSDGGSRWQEWLTGLPDAVIAKDLLVSPSNRVIRFATHGNGVYERKLIGDQATSVSVELPIAIDFRLEQNYPNPFNPSTTIDRHNLWFVRKSINFSIKNVLAING